MAKMAAAADGASALLKALSHPHRLLLLCQLADRERSVGELARFLGIRDSTVSQHLQSLRKDGLVTPRRDGQTIWYALASTPARRLLEALFEIYCAQERRCEEIAAGPADASSGSRKRRR